MSINQEIMKLKQSLNKSVFLCRFIHNWSRWGEVFLTYQSVNRFNKQYLHESGVDRLVAQRRSCKRCGKTQQQSVSIQFISGFKLTETANMLNDAEL